MLTVPLVACIALAVRYASRKAASVGLAWVTLYLGFCLVQRHRAATALDQWLATSPMKPIDRRELKPSFGNVVVWRVLLQAGQECHVMAVRCPLFGEPVVLPGTSQPMFATAEAAILALQVPAGSRQAKDIQRFHDFSAGWIGQLPSDAMILGDLRYSSLPTEIRPLWGIQVNPAEPESHVAMRHFRADRTPSLNRLMKMVQGTPAAPAALP